MINFDDYANENKTEHNQKCSYIPDHPYRISIIGGSESGKTNTLLNLSYLMDPILYQIIKSILNTFWKSMEKILIKHQYGYM